MQLAYLLACLAAPVAIYAQPDAGDMASTLRLVDGNIAQLIADMQTIAKDGLNETLRDSIKFNLEQANALALHNLNGSEVMLQDVARATKPSKLEAFDPAQGMDIANGVQQAVQQVLSLLDPNPKVCMRKPVGRGVGTVLANQCLAGEEPWGALCYPKCKDGYENVGCCICRKKGCGGVQGVTDIGMSCTKPKAYGRGSGYALWNQDKCNRENKQGCEKNGLMWYPKCEKGYHAFGCCICTPDCPAGSHDDGAFCRKDHMVGLEQSGLLCYPKCDEGYMGLGPLCWPKCTGETPFRCGLFCASSSATCASSTVEIVGAAVKVALSIASEDVIGAIATTVQVGKKLIFMDKCPSPSPFTGTPTTSPMTSSPTAAPTTAAITTTSSPTTAVATTPAATTAAPTTPVVTTTAPTTPVATTTAPVTPAATTPAPSSTDAPYPAYTDAPYPAYTDAPYPAY
ncbi:hypothetical protein SPRG_21532 [Saprolegnia parasitica CBS 223.65]|uniref:Secreted protein n=1 Tax=Saprolegnia parasitica (strain CBS 223.65) TaxID=695850 RepID=A0A067BMT2_SAPPC|nr:hypothetical protein SPRG_21532 [Saprolegnia parasitica CBS 223.65]KDO19533.1 hypothetical protein SPRG_21532 [Saprolegnia parasitica CBS 223.65]|eukprot:XP_012209760.1 hypothetical protein SPRG_21532 [Saprolegnia parasitica CBS 223.65]